MNTFEDGVYVTNEGKLLDWLYTMLKLEGTTVHKLVRLLDGSDIT